MKKNLWKIVLCNVITLALSVSVYGQDSGKEKEGRQSDAVAVNKENKEERTGRFFIWKRKRAFNPQADYILFDDGEAFVKKNGKLLPVKSERIVGTMKVNAEGRVLKDDGSESRLKEGEVMTIEGEIVKPKEKEFLKEKIKMTYEEVNSLEQSKLEMQETIFMLGHKLELMETKTDLVNQKMMIVLDFMNKPKNKRKDLREYVENIALLDTAIKETDLKIREVNDLMIGSK